MSTRWLDLRYLFPAGLAVALLYLSWPERTLLVAGLILLLLLLTITGWRYWSDIRDQATIGGGLPSQADENRENDYAFDILTLEQDILTRLNQARQSRGIEPVALHCDLLYRARRHSLRMIKVPFFGTKDIEEGDICDRLVEERGAISAGAKVMRFRDDVDNPAAHCVQRWTRRRRSRRILLYPAFTLSAVGVIRNSRNRVFYVTCLLEAPLV